MKVAIVHYHLKKGGVTRVIENTVRSLNESGVESLVICGEVPDWSAFPFHNVAVVPGMVYSETFHSSKSRVLKASLEETCRNHWGSLPDIWHFHNHSLAKNLQYPVAIAAMAREGQKLLLQIHDFAEDGRPANYHNLIATLAGKDKAVLDNILYPVGDHVAYALINGRDRQFLRRAGLPESQCHLLANPVWLEIDRKEPLNLSEFGHKRFYLYPTRSIRRKNLGEMLLWAAAAEEDEVFGSTLAPDNPTARPIYHDWVEFARKSQLPVHFGLAEQYPFEGMINSAYALLSTSIAEGFGLAYLEPYLAGAQLVGRDLPEITRDFASQHIHLPGLYPRLDVPVGWIGLERLRDTVRQGLLGYYQAYGRTLQKSMMDEAMDEMINGDLVDFGRLDEALQKVVIAQVVKSPTLKLHFAPEKLDYLLTSDQIAHNQNRIRQLYSTERYGQTLKGIYLNLAEARPSPTEFLDTEKVLSAFMDPRRFYLLRT